MCEYVNLSRFLEYYKFTNTLILAVGNDLKNLWHGDPLYLIQYIYINDKINTNVFPFIVNNLTVFLPRLIGTMTGTGRRGMPRDLSDA